MAFGTAKSVEVSSFQGVLIRGFHKTAVVGRGKGGGGGGGGGRGGRHITASTQRV